MLRIASSTNIVVENITLKDPGFWCIVPTHSNRISIRNVVIDANAGGKSPNTDGIEPMWSHNVHVQNATIRNGDDCVTVKSGSTNILVEDLYCRGSHGITVGSVWYDDVTNVTYKRVVMEDCENGPRIKGRTQGNATISNITFEDIFLQRGVGVGCAIDMTYQTPG